MKIVNYLHLQVAKLTLLDLVRQSGISILRLERNTIEDIPVMVKYTEIPDPLNRQGETTELSSLYGLTPKVEVAVIAALVAGSTERIISLVSPLHPADQADLIERLNRAQRKRLVQVFAGKMDPATLTYLPEDILEEVVDVLGTEDLARALPSLESDDAFDILEDLEGEDLLEVLAAMPVGERLIVEETLSYPEDCAGRMMQREVVVCPSHWTVGQSIDYLRSIDKENLPDDFYSIVIINPKHRVLGQVHLGHLLSSDRPIRLSAIMETTPHQIPVTMDKEEVALLFRRYGLVSASVVDDQGKLVGVITVDDVVNVIDEEAEEDLMALAGVSGGSFRSSLVTTVRSRFSWLSVNLLTAIIASVVIGFFDETIERLVALAVLMPIIASMGGNAGTQTVTVAVRALALRQLSRSTMKRFIAKELSAGIINGVVFAAAAAAVSWFWFASIEIAALMGFAMLTNMVVAAMSGAAIPVVLSRFGIDPAVASSVFITTVTDVIGFLTFLGMAAIFIV